MTYEPDGVLAVVDTVMVPVYVGLPLVGLKLTPGAPDGDGLIEDESVTAWDVPLTRETVTVAVVLLPRTTVPPERLTPNEKPKGGGDEDSALTRPIAVFHVWKPEDFRYSPPTQKVVDFQAWGCTCMKRGSNLLSLQDCSPYHIACARKPMKRT